MKCLSIIITLINHYPLPQKSHIKVFLKAVFLSVFFFTNIHNSEDSRGRGRVFFNFSLPFSPAPPIPPLCIVSSQIRSGNLWFLEHKLLTTKLHALKGCSEKRTVCLHDRLTHDPFLLLIS